MLCCKKFRYLRHMSEKQKKQKRLTRLRYKYRLVLINEENFEERLSFRLSRLHVYSLLTILSLFWIMLMIYLLAFTSLREYIPGYTDPALKHKIYRLNTTLDSLETKLYANEQYLDNIRRILKGEEMLETNHKQGGITNNYDEITNYKSVEDSLLRLELEKQGQFNIYFHESEEVYAQTFNKGPKVYFPPLSGIITNQFDPNNKHFGIDIVAKRNDAIKAMDNGIVILAEWTINTGYILAIQHSGNMISVYKHNSSLLKHAGEYVKAGDMISIIGNSGEQSTGPHLHFELWVNGSAVNPLQYIAF